MKSILQSLIYVAIAMLSFSPYEIMVAQWSNNPTVNNSICDAAGWQWKQAILSDESGGAFIAWADGRVIYPCIYGQHISSTGINQWYTNGSLIDTVEPAVINNITLISDGAGGVICTWLAYVSTPPIPGQPPGIHNIIVSQHMNSAGTRTWQLPVGRPVIICSLSTQLELNPVMVGDGAGGAIITWQDKRGGIHDAIYAQRVNASGTVQWTTNGISVDTSTTSNPAIVSDGAGGAIITWSRSSTNYDIYAQRINSAGSFQWGANGVAVCTAAEDQKVPVMVSDGAGGVIIAWQDYRSGTNYDIYAQRINSAGTRQWTINGNAVCTDTYNQYSPSIVSDGTGGAIIAWLNNRGLDSSICVQRVNNIGAVQWLATGVVIDTSRASSPTMMSDGAGGAIITWQKNSGTNYDIYAQKINAAGAIQWTNNGFAVCIESHNQYSPVLVSDGAGSAIVTWSDDRSGTGRDIYASRISFLMSQSSIINISQGWNLVSVPLTQSTYDASVIFPDKFGDMFAYIGGGYVPALSLSLGLGYWVYYTNPTSVTITGLTASGSLQVNCQAGWNLIGSREIDVLTSTLTTNPSGKIFGDIFKYDTSTGGYTPATTITSGEGYWVYMTGACTLAIP